MEDLELPAAQSLQTSPAGESMLVYRPFAAHWDTLTLASRTPVGDGVLLELRGSDGKRDWWLASAGGAILQMRREGQDFERRPLETTGLVAEYQRLVALLRH
jgi:hypothetical protein